MTVSNSESRNYEGKCCYLAGPMRGYPQYNFPAFYAAAAELRRQGIAVWSPAENDVHADGFNPTTDAAQPMRHYMKRDLPAVLNADFVAVLPGWEKSQGAQLEVHVARTCGIPVLNAGDLSPATPSESGRNQIIEEVAKSIEAAPLTYAGPDPHVVSDLRYLIVCAIRDMKVTASRERPE